MVQRREESKTTWILKRREDCWLRQLRKGDWRERAGDQEIKKGPKEDQGECYKEEECDGRSDEPESRDGCLPLVECFDNPSKKSLELIFFIPFKL